MRRRQGQEGVALLLAVLFIVLLTALVVEYTYETRVESAQVAANLNDFRATVAARSAVATGISLLTADMYGLGTDATSTSSTSTSSTSTTSSAAPTAASGSEYDGLDEVWAQGVPYDMVNEAVMQCTITDEYGKLNLNALVSSETGESNDVLAEVLRALFTNRGAEEDPVDAIIDWIDPDDEELPGGAESSFYQGLEVPYACKNASMGSVEELLLIRGVTLDVFFGDPEQEMLPLTDLLTVHGERNGKVNVNTAPLEVLEAYGQVTGQAGLGEAIVEERESSPFLSSEDMVLRGVAPAESEEDVQQSVLVVKSRSFRIRGHGLAGKSKVRIDAYVWRDERQPSEPLRILDWRVMR